MRQKGRVVIVVVYYEDSDNWPLGQGQTCTSKRQGCWMLWPMHVPAELLAWRNRHRTSNWLDPGGMTPQAIVTNYSNGVAKARDISIFCTCFF